MLYRRLRARLGSAQATVATAHAIARVVYRLLKYKVEYDPLSVNEYQKQLRRAADQVHEKEGRQTRLSSAACPGLKRDCKEKRRPLLENALFWIMYTAKFGRFLY